MSSSPEYDKLSYKRKAFVDEFLKTLNATKAYAVAYNITEKLANANAMRLMVIDGVKAAIDEKRLERIKRTNTDADFVLTRLVNEVEADMIDIFDPATNLLLPMDQWPKIWRQGLVVSTTTKTIPGSGAEITEVKLADRARRLEMLGKHIKVNAFAEQVIHRHELANLSNEELDSEIAALEDRLNKSKSTEKRITH